MLDFPAPLAGFEKNSDYYRRLNPKFPLDTYLYTQGIAFELRQHITSGKSFLLTLNPVFLSAQKLSVDENLSSFAVLLRSLVGFDPHLHLEKKDVANSSVSGTVRYDVRAYRRFGTLAITSEDITLTF